MIRPKQINLRELFSVEDVLKAKGFEVLSIGNGSNLLIPLPYSPYTNHNILFEAFNDQQSRLQVLNRIKDSNFTVTNLLAQSLINHPDFVADRSRYSTSFEWYVGELMVRKFSSFSASYGVEIRDVFRNSDASSTTGDYDAVAIMRDINLVYFECKTGKFNTDKIEKCVERAIALHAEFSVVIAQDIKLISLKNCLKGLSHPIMSRIHFHELHIKGNLDSKVYEWNNCFFVKGSGNIEEQMRTIIRINAARKVSHNYFFGFDDDTYDKIGYVKRSIPL